MRSCTYPYATVLDGIPRWVQSYRLSHPLHNFDGQSPPWGMCITPASGGEELHLYQFQVIKDLSAWTPHPRLVDRFEGTGRTLALYEAVVSGPLYVVANVTGRPSPFVRS